MIFWENGILHYIVLDGVPQYSNIQNSYNNIVFNDATFNGTVCSNGYMASYGIVDSSTMNITNIVFLGGMCNYPIETHLFLDPYMSDVLSTNGETSAIFNYFFSGTDDDQILTIANTYNYNSAIFGRAPLPENRLPRVWYLHSITKNDVEELNTFNASFDINFTLTNDLTTGLNYNGFAICHDYFGSYRLEDQDGVRFNYLSYTLDICQEYGAPFEDSYFSFFSQAQIESQYLTYNVTGSDDVESLVLTSQNGDYLTYGRQTLSVEENAINNLSVQLIENPVRNVMKLNISDALGNDLNYEILSIDGKNFSKAKLNNNHSINVETLDSGLYFLTFSSANNFRQTLKFIKR